MRRVIDRTWFAGKRFALHCARIGCSDALSWEWRTRTRTDDGSLMQCAVSRSPDALLVLRSTDADQSVFNKFFVWRTYAGEQIRTARTVIDLGANIGASALYFTIRFPSAQVIAVEPDPANYGILTRNARNCPAVTPVNAAVWSSPTVCAVVDSSLRDDSRSFRPDGLNLASQKNVDPASPPSQVPGTTIDALVDQYFEGNTIDIVKIDVEGAEEELFSPHAIQWTRRCRSIICEFHADDAARSAVAAMKSLGFTAATFGEDILFRRGLDPLKP